MAAAVPAILDALLVARACTGSASGRAMNSAGSCSSPPPPDTASTQPAAIATAMSRTSVGASGSAKGSITASPNQAQESRIPGMSASWCATASGLAESSGTCSEGMSECGIQMARMPTCCAPATSSQRRSPT